MSNKNNQQSSYLKLRENSSDSSRFINNRGDFMKINSATNINVNGNTYHSTKDAAKAISQWGKKS